MPLNKLDNFLKNVEGRILYVSPSDLDSTDSITNQGNSQTAPFKTLQRALIEAARFSYQKGTDNDLVEKTTILLMPGSHEIDNRPGYAIQRSGDVAQLIEPDGTILPDSTSLDLGLETNFDITQEDNVLYKFNSIHGGVIVPRGTSIVGLDLRKTKLRPKYVPNPTDSTPTSSVFKITGGCYFWQFSVFDGDEYGKVYTNNANFVDESNKSQPLFSHHKLTVFEYADGVNEYSRTGLTDLDMYYHKISRAYNTASTRNIDEKYPISIDGFTKQRAEWEIVGAFANDPINITSIQAGTLSGVPTNEVFVTCQTAHNLTAGTPIKIRGVRPAAYNISTKVTAVDPVNLNKFTYTLPDFDRELQTPGESSGATVIIETDTVSGASPYIFNCSLRSVWGMNGMLADGSKADGFRSMVVAQFTGVSLQKDDRAFVKYISSNRKYQGNDVSPVYGTTLPLTSSSTNPATIYHLDSEAIYREGWETAHVRITNDAILQIVSVFAIGYNRHFSAESGGDASITNSNSNFGQLALVSDGFKKDAFEKDDKAYITHIIPPKAITSNEETADWLSIDVGETIRIGNDQKLYLYGFTSKEIIPPSITQGFRVGAKKNDTLYVNINKQNYSADILMVNHTGAPTTSSVKEYPIGTPASNIFTTLNSVNHQFFTGEKVIILSDDGDLPENIEEKTTYYVIRLSATQFKVAASLANALSSPPKPLNVYQGTNLRVLSRVTDKESGDYGHPVQYDEYEKQWYINTSDSSGSGGIYNKLLSSGVAGIGARTEPGFLKRISDERSLDDKIYKLRLVVPKENANAKNPENGFIIQESSSTGVRTDSDFTLQHQRDLTRDDINYNRNPRFISSCTFSNSPTTVTVTTEIPHNLQLKDTVTIKNITDNHNPVGAGNSGYNGTFSVASIPNDLQFTYNPGRVLPTSVTNTFNKTAIGAATSIPRFERTDLQSNIYLYRNEIFSDYTLDQDGIYHSYPLSSDYQVPIEFTSLKYNQNVVDLYPQLDRDNINDNPEASISFASRSPLGKVVTNNPLNSITRETVDKLNETIGIGLTIKSISSSDTSATITFHRDHNLSGISSGYVKSSASNFTPGTHYNVRVTTDAANNNWNGTMATVVVAAGGNITNYEITNPGSGFQVGEKGYFDKSQIGSSGSDGVIQQQSTGNSGLLASQLTAQSSNLTLQFTGAGVGRTEGYFRLSAVNSKNVITISKRPADIGISTHHYAFIVGPTIQANASTSSNLTTFTSTNPHGLKVGNRFQFNDSNDNNLGSFIVEDLDKDNEVTKFTAVTNLSDGDLTNGWILKHGLSSNDAPSAKNEENISVRGTHLFYNEIASLSSAVSLSDDTITVSLLNSQGSSAPLGALDRFPYGSYLQIDDEIMRVSKNSLGGSNNILTVIRGLLGTPSQVHLNGSLIRRIKPIPIELHRPSILRASGHTFEYLGYGPGNYSTALPQVQVRSLTEREEFLSQSQERSAGAVVYTGMNDKGDFYIGNQKKSALTGEEITFDTPIPTVAGEDPGRLSVVFDEAIIKERLVVEGGKTDTSLSQFDGPVNFNEELKIKGQMKIRNEESSISATSGALVVTGGVGVGGTINIGSGSSIRLPDDSKALFGDDNDLEIYHEASTDQSIIKSSKKISLMSASGIEIEDETGKQLADFTKGGASRLFYDVDGDTTELKFETTSSGAIVSGICTATTFSGNVIGNLDGIVGGTTPAAGSFTTIDSTSVISGILTANNYFHGDLTGNADTATLADTATIANDVTDTITINTSGNITGAILHGDTITLPDYPSNNTATGRLRLGAGNDLDLYHEDGTNYIESNNGSTTIRIDDEKGKGVYIEDPNGGSARYVAKFEKHSTSGKPFFELFHGGDWAIRGEEGLNNQPNGIEVNGQLRAGGDIVAFISDERLKTNIKPLDNALDKVLSLNGFTYTLNETAVSLGYDSDTVHVGVSAQQVQQILPEAVAPAPKDDKYLTVKYEKLVPLLIESIKELNQKVEELQQKLSDK